MEFFIMVDGFYPKTNLIEFLKEEVLKKAICREYKYVIVSDKRSNPL